jgi:chromosome segregation ATPase
MELKVKEEGEAWKLAELQRAKVELAEEANKLRAESKQKDERVVDLQRRIKEMEEERQKFLEESHAVLSFEVSNTEEELKRAIKTKEEQLEALEKQVEVLSTEKRLCIDEGTGLRIMLAQLEAEVTKKEDENKDLLETLQSYLNNEQGPVFKKFQTVVTQNAQLETLHKEDMARIAALDKKISEGNEASRKLKEVEEESKKLHAEVRNWEKQLLIVQEECRSELASLQLCVTSEVGFLNDCFLT